MLLFSLFITTLAWYATYHSEINHQKQTFDQVTERLTDDLNSRLDVYLSFLRAVNSFYHLDTPPSETTLKHYVQRLNPEQHYPGLDIVRFIAASAPNQSIELFRARDAQHIQLSTDPNNQLALNQAAKQAAHHHGISLSAKLRWSTPKGEEAGFSVYLPVYQNEQLYGWIAADYRAATLMQNIIFNHPTSEYIDIDVYDGYGMHLSRLLFDSDSSHSLADKARLFSYQQPIVLAHHQWTLLLSAEKDFINHETLSKSSIILLIGSILSAILALFIGHLGSSHAQALRSAIQLAEEAHKNQVLLKSASDGVFINTLDGKVIQVNDALCHLLGYPESELINQSAQSWSINWSEQEINEQLSQLSHPDEAPDFWCRFKHRDGHIIDVELSSSQVHVGALTLIYTSVRDITERKKMERALKDSNAAAQAANRSKSQFLANMSHEIRTPMNAIIGLSQLCLQTQLDQKQHNYLHKIYSSGQVLLGIINDILDLSKIEAGKMTIEQIPFDLEEVLHSLVTIVQNKTEEKGLDFVLDIAPDLPQQLVGDPLRLEQVLINLTGNAVKFTNRGHISLSINLIAEDEQNIRLSFSVKDTGIGMSAAQCARLFQAFQQADSSTTRKYGGTGLGLSITKQLIQLMHGDIQVESQENQGSRFSFDILFEKTNSTPLALDLLPQTKIVVIEPQPYYHALWQRYLSALNREFVLVSTPDLLQAQDNNTLYLIDHHIHTDLPSAQTIIIGGSGPHELNKPFTFHDLYQVLVQHNQTQSIADLTKPTLIQHESLKDKRVLLAEDNEINQLVAQDLLEMAGLKVWIANHGEEAVALSQTQEFDCILMDMQMPVMDGLTATRILRNQPQTQQIPIIALTANAGDGDRQQCLAAGMNDHIGKPFNHQQMLVTLSKWLSNENRP